VNTIFHEALQQPPATRSDWLANACGEDEALRLEAESLLAAHDTADGFLEQPATFDPIDVAESALLPGTRLGSYRVIEEIGRGGMGVVYLAEDERLGRLVALKSLSPEIAADPVARERLRREARAAATITHPAVAVVHALEEADGHLFMVTEYVPGRTLRKDLESGPVEPFRAVGIAVEVTRALAAAHRAGVIHRDLKPENVIITDGNAVKVVDFGIARVPGFEATRLTMAGTFLGTPAYMAPEQLAGASADGRVDIFSLGVLLGELLTGVTPHESSCIKGSDLPDTRDIPVPLQQILDRCLQHDPTKRYGSASELLDSLEAVLENLQTGRKQPPRQRTVSARWWWEFHQGMVALTYGLMLMPTWVARSAAGRTGSIIFAIAVAATVAASGLRLHLWFTSRFYPEELNWLRSRVVLWIRAADGLFVLALVSMAVLVGSSESALATLLFAFGTGAAIAFLVIEPATTRAAFGASLKGHR
jgi:predicted Ser/Thr protein kinase